LPIVHITAVPEVSGMVGVNRVLRGVRITCVLGDSKLTKEKDKKLRRKYVMRALEILKADIKGKQIFTLEAIW
jgi:betaine reductase